MRRVLVQLEAERAPHAASCARRRRPAAGPSPGATRRRRSTSPPAAARGSTATCVDTAPGVGTGGAGRVEQRLAGVGVALRHRPVDAGQQRQVRRRRQHLVGIERRVERDVAADDVAAGAWRARRTGRGGAPRRRPTGRSTRPSCGRGTRSVRSRTRHDRPARCITVASADPPMPPPTIARSYEPSVTAASVRNARAPEVRCPHVEAECRRRLADHRGRPLPARSSRRPTTSWPQRHRHERRVDPHPHRHRDTPSRRTPTRRCPTWPVRPPSTRWPAATWTRGASTSSSSPRRPPSTAPRTSPASSRRAIGTPGAAVDRRQRRLLGLRPRPRTGRHVDPLRRGEPGARHRRREAHRLHRPGRPLDIACSPPTAPARLVLDASSRAGHRTGGMGIGTGA